MPGDGDRESLVINSRDVTGQKQLEAQLRQAQKMEAIGQLAGGVAHDFNNLLSVIFGHSAVLARALALEDSLSESLAEINRAAERGAALTGQLLAFSRQQILAPNGLDLTPWWAIRTTCCGGSSARTCSVPDRIYGLLLRELPGRAVGVEATDKSDFLVDGAVTGPIDAFDSKPRSRWH